jgi:hypothetical protein
MGLAHDRARCGRARYKGTRARVTSLSINPTQRCRLKLPPPALLSSSGVELPGRPPTEPPAALSPLSSPNPTRDRSGSAHRHELFSDTDYG